MTVGFAANHHVMLKKAYFQHQKVWAVLFSDSKRMMYCLTNCSWHWSTCTKINISVNDIVRLSTSDCQHYFCGQYFKSMARWKKEQITTASRKAWWLFMGHSDGCSAVQTKAYSIRNTKNGELSWYQLCRHWWRGGCRYESVFSEPKVICSWMLMRTMFNGNVLTVQVTMLKKILSRSYVLSATFTCTEKGWHMLRMGCWLHIFEYRQTSDISRTKFQNLNIYSSRLAVTFA